MKLTMAHHFDPPADQVWAMFHDPESHIAKFTSMGHRDLEVLDQSRALVEELRRVILEFPGRSEVHIDLGGSQVRLRPPFCVNHSASPISELRVLLGTSAVVL